MTKTGKHIKILKDLLKKEKSKVWLFKLFLMYSNPLWRICGVSTKLMKEECETGASLEKMRNSKYFLHTVDETATMLATIAGVQDLQRKMRISSVRVSYSNTLTKNNIKAQENNVT